VANLYIVATPIGNLDDISARALVTLEKVDLILAEDTRTTRKLLNHYKIKKTLISFNEHNQQKRIPFVINTLTKGDVALVSDAGVPTISDPGQRLIAELHSRGIRVIPIPGPTAIAAALSASGITGNSFLFLGFLPRRQGERHRLLNSLISFDRTIIIFESPHRVLKTLNELALFWGDRNISVCRELTKLYEEIYKGSVSQAISHFANPRGEFTLVIEGNSGNKETWSQMELKTELLKLKTEGYKAKEAVELLANVSGHPKRLIYEMWLSNHVT